MDFSPYLVAVIGLFFFFFSFLNVMFSLALDFQDSRVVATISSRQFEYGLFHN